MIIKRIPLSNGNKSIVIGENEMADKLIIHSAHVLSDSIVHICDLKIENTDKLIYICGHTNINKRTIGGYRMSDLAKVLIDSGYNGTQDIYITSCESNKEISGIKSLKDELRLSLYNRINSTAESEVPSNYNCCQVKSDSDGIAVVTDMPELIVITSTNRVDTATLILLQLFQNICKSKKIHMSEYDETIHKKVTEYKNRILKNHIAYSEVYSALRLAAFLLSLLTPALLGFAYIHCYVFLDSFYYAIIFAALMLIMLLNILEHLIMRRYSEDNLSTTKNLLPKAFFILVLKYSLYLVLIMVILPQI